MSEDKKIVAIEYPYITQSYFVGQGGVVSIDVFDKNGEMALVEWVRITFDNGKVVESPMRAVAKVIYA